MKNLIDKDTRLKLLRKYLEAETSPEEERMLAGYYARTAADPDEQDVARLILSGTAGIDAILSNGDMEFERMTGHRKKPLYLAIAAAATVAAVAILLNFSYRSRTEAAVDTMTEVITEPVESAPAVMPEVSPAATPEVPPAPQPSVSYKKASPEKEEAQTLSFEDIFPSSRTPVNPEHALDIEDELELRLLAETLEAEVQERTAAIKDERTIINL